VHPDDQAQVQHEYETSVRERKPYNHVHRLLFPGGRVKHVRQQGKTEYDGDRPVRSLGTVLDITEVRLARQALQQLNEALESRVNERTSELAQANRELEAFTYSVSHDLRTPLRSIHGFASVLEEDEAQGMSELGRQHLRRIQYSARRMGQLITDLLSLAHLGRAPMQQVPVNLSELALAVAGELQRTDPEREVDWHIQDGLQAMADPGLMRVVLQNLLGNAWKYTGQTPDARISLTREQHSGGMTTFCVRDNGAGFDMAYAAQLFQPFRRLHAHHEFEGSGVGLASVQRVVQRHGGEVRGEGVVGGGAAFYFTVPDEPRVLDPVQR
jgi:light-regulated signal transduction histidine kinase (bacteriophytochrome)